MYICSRVLPHFFPVMRLFCTPLLARGSGYHGDEGIASFRRRSDAIYLRNMSVCRARPTRLCFRASDRERGCYEVHIEDASLITLFGAFLLPTINKAHSAVSSLAIHL